MNRLDRLTAILIHLQSKKIVRAEEMANRFEISVRTVYRDVKSLMEAGVPIGSEAGTGYFIVDGYSLPPVMFSREEASSILLAGKLVEKLTDQSVRLAFENAMMKIKSVLNPVEKENLELLQSSVQVSRMPVPESAQFPNNFLTTIQNALVDRDVLEIEYSSNTEETTKRKIEPIGISFYSGSWHVIGWCRMREGYRDFRADRIRNLKRCADKFDGRNRLSLQEYLNSLMSSYKDLKKAIVIFDKSVFQFRRYMYGYVSEEDLGDKVRITFLVENFSWLSRYLLSFGNAVTIQEPEELNDLLAGLVEELQVHYLEIANTKH